MVGAVLYLLQSSCVALAGALVLVESPRVLRVPVVSRALVGAASAPFVLAGFTLLVPVIWPHAPRLVFALPAIAAFAFCVCRRRTLLRILRRTSRFAHAGAECWIAAVATGLMLAWVTGILWTNAMQPLVGNDALIYFNEARVFAAERSPRAIPSFTATAPDVVATHPHTFFYQAYIAQAFVTATRSIAPPDDLAPRIASQASTLFLLLGVLGLGAASRVRTAGALSVLLLLSADQLGYLSQHDSRDGFRILSLVLLTVVLLPLSRRTHTPSAREYLLPALSSAVVVYAHTLNILFLGIVAIGYALVSLRERVPSARVLVALGALGLGAVLPGLHYVESWLHSGSLMGSGMYYRFYAGTPLWDAFVSEGAWARPTPGFFGAILEIGRTHGPVLTAFGVLGAAASMLLPMFRPYRLPSAVFLLALVLPLVEALESGGVGMRQAMLANVRYPLALYPFAAVSVAAFVSVLLVRPVLGNRVSLTLRRCAVATTVLAAATSASMDVRHWEQRTWAPRYVEYNYWKIARFLDNTMEAGENWATDLYAAAYYTSREPVFLFSEAGSGLFRSSNRSEILERLRADDIRVVALRNDLDSWWSRTELLRVLRDEAVESERRLGFWTVFVLPRDPASTAQRESNQLVR